MELVILFFGVFSLFCWAIVWWFLRKPSERELRDAKRYTNAIIVDYKDQSTKYAIPYVRYQVGNKTIHSYASVVDRRLFPEGTIVPISYRDSQIKDDGWIRTIQIELPDIVEKEKRIQRNFTRIMLFFAIITTLIAIAFIAIEIRKIIN